MFHEDSMRKIFTIIILLCIGYFLGGAVASYRHWISKDTYLTYAGIVGGLASVAGLVALTRPAITKSDIQAIEVDTLKSITQTEEQLKSLELARTRTEGQIVSLEEKKKEMELLVKKASLALFLKEQYLYQESQIVEEIARNSHLRTALEKAKDAAEKLEALNDEIEVNSNVRLLKEIIASASRRQPTLKAIIDEMPAVLRIPFYLVRAVGTIIDDVGRILTK
jgi:hypothetical protein